MKVIIIGAGPAGLTAAYQLAGKGVSVIVLEADPEYVGGISKTISYKGYHFDIGGHRFFSKSKQVEDFWDEILGSDLIERPRKSRIYYNGKFFSYPLKAQEALFNLGVIESALCMLSYAHARVFPNKNPRNFEEWVSNQFGKRLFNIFFKTYTEKVWGMSCKDISADWAAQRIKGLSLGSAIKHALFQPKKKDRAEVIKTLIDSFRYPRKGPGMMWEATAAKTKKMGGEVVMGAKVNSLHFDKQTGKWKVTAVSQNGIPGSYEGDHVISSAPMRELVKGLTPAPSEKVIASANALKYRDFLTVSLILKDRDLFDDNWIYIHDPSVKVGRIQNFKSWSPEMIPEPGMCCYGLEYFCFEGDGLWTSSDSSLIDMAKKELAQLGLAAAEDVVDGCVVRQAKAYPVYTDDYSNHVNTIREALEKNYPTMHVVGRNGMHKYNNQDHAMMTAMLTVENILNGNKNFDVWQVNQDAEYIESGAAGSQSSVSGLRMVPEKVKS